MPFFGEKGESDTSCGAICAIALALSKPHGGAMVDVKRSPLEEPDNAAHAWSRFRRIMRTLALVTGAVVLLVTALLWLFYPEASIHFFIAVALGIGFTMILGGTLMALAFLASGTGHDEAVDNRLPSADEIFGDKDR